MRFDEIEAALDLAKRHVDEASTTTTFADMRIQLNHAQEAAKRAIDGMEVQIKGSLAQPTLLPTKRSRT